jgi:hypothetical protein
MTLRTLHWPARSSRPGVDSEGYLVLVHRRTASEYGTRHPHYALRSLCEQLLAELAGAQVSHDIEEHWPQDRERVAAVRLRLAAVAAARHGDASAWETLHRLAVDREANRSF